MSDPADLHYTDTHEWVEIVGETLRVGITDFAQHRHSDVTHVELPEPDDHHYETHEDIGVVESLKMASDFHAPVAGTIISINIELLSRPELINQDPYGNGWLVVMQPDDMSEVEELLDVDEYEVALPEEESEEA